MIKAEKQGQSVIIPGELNRLLAAGGRAVLLDVRTPGEFAAAHVPGARLLPLDELDAAEFVRQRGAEGKRVYVLCQSGGRAKRAIEKFRAAGFEDCVLVEGGTQAWMDAGLPVTCGTPRVLPLMRQVQLVVGVVSAGGAARALWVNAWFALLPLVTGCGLVFAGLTGMCGLAMALAKMPWNRRSDCGRCG